MPECIHMMTLKLTTESTPRTIASTRLLKA